MIHNTVQDYGNKKKVNFKNFYDIEIQLNVVDY